jgi:hypothetical protein
MGVNALTIPHNRGPGFLSIQPPLASTTKPVLGHVTSERSGATGVESTPGFGTESCGVMADPRSTFQYVVFYGLHIFLLLVSFCFLAWLARLSAATAIRQRLPMPGTALVAAHVAFFTLLGMYVSGCLRWSSAEKDFPAVEPLKKRGVRSLAVVFRYAPALCTIPGYYPASAGTVDTMVLLPQIVSTTRLCNGSTI